MRLKKLRTRLAAWLDPEMLECEARYHRMINALAEAARELNYSFPTVSILSGWVIARAVDSDVSVEELVNRIRSMVGSDEAEELGLRLQRALDQANQTKH